VQAARRAHRLRILGVGLALCALVAVFVVLATANGGGAIATVAGRPPAPCTVEVRSLRSAAAEVAHARGRAVVCLAAGKYHGTLTLSGAEHGPATVRPAPGAHVALGPVTIATGDVTIAGLWIDGEVGLEAGVSNVLLSHNDITGGAEGVVFDTSDCRTPNAPTWPGCEPQAPVSDVTISANHFHNIGQGTTEDAIHLDNWRNVTVSGNEFDHIDETGNHTDCLQGVFGGTNLTFTHNYEHDNDCQGIFIKDGDAENVTISENLFVRDTEGGYANFAQLWNIQGLTLEHNTIWDGKGLALVADNASFAPLARIEHNLLQVFTVEPPVGTPYALREGGNIFASEPTGFRPAVSDRVRSHPPFRNRRIGDYRLTGRLRSAGIDWSPAGQHYGPAN
jgi:hypothetical protein